MEVRMTTEVSLAEAEDAILAFGNQNAIHLVGEPGVGKTAMFERVVAKTGFRGVYIDTPNTELGDIGIPMPHHETKTTSLYPNGIGVSTWLTHALCLLTSSLSPHQWLCRTCYTHYSTRDASVDSTYTLTLS